MARQAASGMSWIVDTRTLMAARRDLIGPCHIVLVVGPSGAGKGHTDRRCPRRARGRCERCVSPTKRTRLASASEDHATMSEQGVNKACASGAFAFWWDAHGHRYGIPTPIDANASTSAQNGWGRTPAIRSARGSCRFAPRSDITAPRRNVRFVPLGDIGELIQSPRQLS
jgi:ribose 1,5-bisphosphokinase